MNKRNITIAAAAVVFAVAGIAYTQQSDDNAAENTAAAETTADETATATETVPVTNNADNANEVSATNNTEEVSADLPSATDEETSATTEETE